MQVNKIDDIFYFLVERFMRKAKRTTIELFKKYEIPLTVEQWVIISFIAENEGISQRELSGKTFKEPAALTRTLDVMEKKGLARRERVVGDRRKYGLYLTKEGKKLYERTLQLVNLFRQKSLENVSDPDMEKMKEILRGLYDNIVPAAKASSTEFEQLNF